MIAELIRQYDTLKRCNIDMPDPYFDEMGIWIEIVLKPDDSFRVNWLGKSKKAVKEEPCIDLDCPVTEQSACRSSGNESPHGLVDNVMWIFGKFPTEKQKKKAQEALEKQATGKHGKAKVSPDELRRQAYLNQVKAFYEHNPESLAEIKDVYDRLSNDEKRNELWIEVESLLKEKIVKIAKGKIVKLFKEDPRKWQTIASKANVRWVIERIGVSGKPVNALVNVKKEWKAFQEHKSAWWIVSLVDGQAKPARINHPRIRGASLVSFNNPATYCNHLSAEYRRKPGRKEEETDGSALPAQIGFEEAEKYAKALDWLIENSSVNFGDSVNCIWIDQEESDGQQLDMSAHDLVKPQNEKSIFTRGKAKRGKGHVLADSGDLIIALQRFRNGQKAGYRDKRFYLLSLLLRRKGRHAILGSYAGNMGLLFDNTNKFVNRTRTLIPAKYLNKEDEAREFCPTLLDILSAAGIKSERKQRLVWDREVIEVIVAGRPLPTDLCRLVIQRAIKNKHLERSEKKSSEYLALLSIAAGCTRHYLTAIAGKEGYGMGLDINIKDAGYLVGRLFAVCENIQKRGRNGGPTLSDKLFSAAIDMPRQTLAQLYKNCLSYDMYKADSEWFTEIFDKIKLNDGDSGQGETLPENGVDQFEFMLGYWHQRSELRPKITKSSDDDNNINKLK